MLNCKKSDEKSIVWYQDRKNAFEEAEKNSKNIILFFQKSKCNPCNEILNRFQTDDSLKSLKNQFVFLKISESDSIFQEFLADDRFLELKEAEFFFVIINSSEEILAKSNNLENFKTILGNFR